MIIYFVTDTVIGTEVREKESTYVHSHSAQSSEEDRLVIDNLNFLSKSCARGKDGAPGAQALGSRVLGTSDSIYILNLHNLLKTASSISFCLLCTVPLTNFTSFMTQRGAGP